MNYSLQNYPEAPPNQIPLMNLVLFGLLLSGILSTVLLYAEQPPSISNGIDVLLLASCFLLAWRCGVSSDAIWGFLACAYAAVYVLRSVYSGNDLADTLLATKFLFYLGIFSLPAKIKPQGQFSLLWVYRAALCLLLFKYALSVGLLQKFRPELWVENNYELLALMMLAAASFSRDVKIRYSDIIGLIVVVGLSGSRSAAAMLCILLIASPLPIQGLTHYRIGRVRIFLTIVTIALLAISLSKFGSGVNLLESDRFLFLSRFLDELSIRGIWSIVFGSGYLTPLDSNICGELQFWNRVFGEMRYLTCHSVIFHAGIMRIITDHGILVFGLAVFFLYRILSHRFSFRSALLILTLVLTSAASVSAFYSSYFGLGLYLALFLPTHANRPD